MKGLFSGFGLLLLWLVSCQVMDQVKKDMEADDKLRKDWEQAWERCSSMYIYIYRYIDIYSIKVSCLIFFPNKLGQNVDLQLFMDPPCQPNPPDEA